MPDDFTLAQKLAIATGLITGVAFMAAMLYLWIAPDVRRLSERWTAARETGQLRNALLIGLPSIVVGAMLIYRGLLWLQLAK